MALRTRSRVFAATSGLSFSTRLTVARDTSQCRATSRSVTRAMAATFRRVFRSIQSLLRSGVTDQAQIDRLSRDAQTSRRQRYETAPAHREYLTQGHRELMQFEKQAVAIRTYQPVFYPAVLQTSAIAEAVISRWTEGEAARRVRHEARLERKAQIIDRPDGPEYYVVLDEAVIKRRFAGLAATAEQLELTTQIAQLPNVHIRMVPFDRGADMVAMGSFIIVDLVGDDESAIIYRESFNKDEILDSPPDVLLHRAAFDRLWKVSLTEEVTASALVAEAAALRSTLERDGER